MIKTKSYNKLLNKLEKFIKRYYYDLILKGLIFFILISSSLFLLFSVVEYFGYLNSTIRAILFFAYLLVNLYIFATYIVKPLLGLYRIGKSIGNYEAAKILGRHFKNEIDDKIINTLQLGELLNENNLEIINAGIEQKSNKLITYKFSNAINVKKNYKKIPLVSLALILIISGIYTVPGFFAEPAKRIIKFNTHFQKPYPFDVNLINDKLLVYNNENLNLEIEVLGKSIPEEFFIIMNSKKIRMNKSDVDEFSYEFKNIRNSFDFNIYADGFYFGPYSVEVLLKPVIKSFTVNIDYPDYTGIEDERFNNSGDHRVPEGSRVEWNFFTENVHELSFIVENDTLIADNIKEQLFNVEYLVKNSFEYKINTYRETAVRGDSLNYYIELINDKYPGINVEEQRDPVLISHAFFRGIINDDYGFSNLEFLYRIYDPVNKVYDNEGFNKANIDFNKNNLNQVFYHQFDLSKIDIRPGEIVEYKFRVTDNDFYNGPKSSNSVTFSYQLPTQEELIAEERQSNEEIKSDLKRNVDDAKEAFEEIEALKKSLLDQDNVSWEQKENLKELLDKKDEIENNIENIKKEHDNAHRKSEQFSEKNENLEEKHKELQRLYDEVLSEEFKELYEKLMEEMDKLNKEDLFEKLDEMQFEFQDLERKMDRMLELFKQLELEKILDESIEALEEVEKNQLESIDKNLENSESDDIYESQEETKDSYDSVEDMLKEFRDKNEELSRPNELDDTEGIQNEIRQNIEKALDELNKSNNRKAMPSQKQSLEKMQELKESLMSMQNSLFKEALYEDAMALRQLMENLLKTSLYQEELILEVKEISYSDPKYVDLIVDQQKILQDLKFIEDSLVALSKRQRHVEGFITREIADINLNINKAITELSERRKPNAATRQQYGMMHINNLMLLLNESLENMMSEMANMSGEGMEGEMSGQGKPSFQGLGEMQEKMNEMLEQMQQGNQPMPGETGEGGMSMSESLARMAAEQQAIRNELKKLAEEYSKDGQKLENVDNILNDMERTELDIIRNKVGKQTMLRQERIRSRLLEHERAEIEREKEERREGNTAKDYEISNPNEFFEYNRIKKRELEMLKNLPPEYRIFFKNLIENYFLNIDTE